MKGIAHKNGDVKLMVRVDEPLRMTEIIRGFFRCVQRICVKQSGVNFFALMNIFLRSCIIREFQNTNLPVTKQIEVIEFSMTGEW